jgi:hypothetical protein
VNGVPGLFPVHHPGTPNALSDAVSTADLTAELHGASVNECVDEWKHTFEAGAESKRLTLDQKRVIARYLEVAGGHIAGDTHGRATEIWRVAPGWRGQPTNWNYSTLLELNALQAFGASPPPVRVRSDETRFLTVADTYRGQFGNWKDAAAGDSARSDTPVSAIETKVAVPLLPTAHSGAAGNQLTRLGVDCMLLICSHLGARGIDGFMRVCKSWYVQHNRTANNDDLCWSCRYDG